MKVKAVLFDLDGVLFDSVDAWHKTFNEVLKHYGKPQISKERFLREVFGQLTQDDLTLIPAVSVEELVGLYERFYQKNAYMIRVFEGAVELLKLLKKKGVKTAVVTNTPKKLALSSLRATGLLGLIDSVKTSDDVPVGKPNPEMLVAALDELKVDKEDAVMVGDTKFDVQAAINAGIRFIGVGVEGDETIGDIRELKSVIL